MRKLPVSLAHKIADNLEAQHRLIAEQRKLMAGVPTDYSLGGIGSTVEVARDFAFGDAAAINEPGENFYYDRLAVAKALRARRDRV